MDEPRSFLSHVEELRFRALCCFAAIGGGSLLAYQFVDWIIIFLARPVGHFIYLQPTEALMVRIKIACLGGALIAMPYVLYQTWKFVHVALSPKEKNSLAWIFPSSYLLFMMGFSFGLFVLVPAGTKFLMSYSNEKLTAQFSIDYYANFVGILCLVLGLTFQMPLVSFFLAKLGLLSPLWLKEQRRYAVLIIYIFSAVLTPGPDPVTALLLFVPAYLLYECSIQSAQSAIRD